MLSRWCAAPEPEIWKSLGLDGEPDVEFPVDQHDRCKFEIKYWHDGHDDCCWNEYEKEARACTCECHSPLV